MHTRIRYINATKYPEFNMLQSKDYFEINKCKFYIYLDILYMEYSIYDFNKIDKNGFHSLIIEGKAKSLFELKKLAKQSLIDLGIEFKSESRSKKDIDDWELNCLKDYP